MCRGVILLCGGAVLCTAGGTAASEAVPLEPVLVEADLFPESSFERLASHVDLLPYTLDVIPIEEFRERGGDRLSDLTGLIPGVVRTAENDDGQGDRLAIRGFTSTWISLNGVRRISFAETPADLSNIERIEVLKGANGLAIGAGAPGGAINLVTAKPMEQSQVTAEFEAGRFDRTRLLLDATGGVASLRSLSYRAIVSAERGESFRSTYEQERLLVAPSLAWRYAPGAELLLEGSYAYADTPFDSGVFYLEEAGFKDNLAPRTLSYHDTSDYSRNIQKRVSAYLRQPLSDALEARVTAEYLQRRIQTRAYLSFPAETIYESGDLMPPYTWTGESVIDRAQTSIRQPGNTSRTAQVEVRGQAATGNWQHRYAVGALVQRDESDKRYETTGNVKLVDIFDPDYEDETYDGVPPLSVVNAFSLDTLAAFAEYRADVGGWHATAGLRVDRYDLDESEVFTQQRDGLLGVLLPDERSEQRSQLSDQAPSWRLAVQRDLLAGWSLHASASTGFLPNPGLDADGKGFEPLDFDSQEAGLRYLGKRARLEINGFHIVQRNIVQPDPQSENPEDPELVAVGRQRSQGVEFDGRMRLGLLQLQLLGAYVDARTTRNSEGAEGNRLYNIPYLSGSTAVLLDFSRWLGAGSEFETAVQYVGERGGDDYHSFSLPAYTRVDAGLRLGLPAPGLKLRLFVENLFDVTYYEASENRADRVYPGSARLYAATLQYSIH